jgi:PhoH-like ATPase
VKSALPEGLARNSCDNTLLGITLDLSKTHCDSEVTLISKDINLRIKAHALNIRAEDYTNDQVLDDTELLYTGMTEFDSKFWDKLDRVNQEKESADAYTIPAMHVNAYYPNQFLYPVENNAPTFMVRHCADGAVLEVIKDHTQAPNSVWGIHARNREQNFALNLLVSPDIDFVTLLGQAGTGKTLLTLASALAQTLEEKRYTEIVMTRATLPVGEDIGFLPGTEEEKMGPWMGALEDNLDVLHETGRHDHGAWGRAVTHEFIRNRIHIKSLSFMRGRTFLRKFIIIDEAQNLSPHQVKTLITRAGPGSKIVCLGNIAQIDTPYLTATTSGLTYAVDRFKGWAHSGHVTLQRGERSRLADYASEML